MFAAGGVGNAAGFCCATRGGVILRTSGPRARRYVPLVILTKVRTQSPAATAFVTLDPDFRQDDGVGLGWFAQAGGVLW